MKPRFAVLGYPLGHTLSPALHKILFRRSGIDAEYTAIPLTPEEFPVRAGELFELNGFNVTMPYKQRIIPFLNGATEEALRFQSVNTVGIYASGRRVGHNTDIAGIIKSVELLGASLRGNICIAGAGSTARMLSTEIVRRGGKVTIGVREGSMPKGEALVHAVSRQSASPSVTVRTLESLNQTFDLLVNATPCGMAPDTAGCPFPDRVILASEKVLDLIYNPSETTLLAKARAMGKKALNGLPMLVWQAAGSHEFWYHAKFTDTELLDVVDELSHIL